MKVVGPRSLYTKMLRLSDELHDNARSLADDGNDTLAVRTEQISLACRRLAEHVGNEHSKSDS